MAWISCEEEFPRESSEAEDGTRNHTRRFIMEADSDSDDGASALLSGLLPPRYSQHPNDGGALLLRRSPRGLDEYARAVRVTCDYSSKVPSFPSGLSSSGGDAGGGSEGGAGLEEQNTDNPLSRTPDVFFDSETTQEAIEYDHDGQRYATSAREPFDPPKMVERDLLALNITKNIANFNPAFIGTYTGAVNEVDFLGYPQDEVLLRKLTARPKWEKNYFYWEVYARFIFNPKLPASTGSFHVIRNGTLGTVEPVFRGTWLDLVLDAGYMKLVSNVPREIVGLTGQKPTRPVLLNGAGEELVADTLGGVVIAGVYLSRRPRHRRDFNNLGLF